MDDEAAVIGLLCRYLGERGFEPRSASGAAEALDTLSREPFDLVLSDLRMPGGGGIELLREVRRLYPDLAVLMVTGCEDVSMAVEAMKAGALDYVLKPFRLDDVERSVRAALDRNRETRRRDHRMRDLQQTVERQAAELRGLLGAMEETSEGTLVALVTALDAREHETQAHSRRVSEYAVLLARRLGIEGEGLETIRRGALLHDIGKIGVPDRVLLKPAPLDEQEWHQMRRHPSIGYWILNGIPWLRPASEIVLGHHERYDGAGYPNGLRGEEIPLGARIFALADTLDAITSPRPYHSGHSFQAAREEIAAARGTQFDPEIAGEFLRVPISAWSAIRARTLLLAADTPANLPRLVPRHAG